jgi:diguanylate cyclase (GGDEF)-like protein/PAS domain S-box-containing protein
MNFLKSLFNKRRTLKSQIAISVTLLFILFSAITGYVGKGYFEDKIKESIFSAQTTLVSSLANNIDDKLNLIQQSLIAEAARIETEHIADSNQAQKYLDSRQALKSLFNNALFLFSKDGKIIAESPYIEGRRGKDISFRDYFRITMSTGQPHISAPYTSTHNPDHPAIILTAPIRDKNGAIVALLAGSFDLLGNNILAEVSATKLGKTGYIYLSTTDRTLIMHPDHSRIMKQDAKPGMNHLYDKAIAGFNGSGETVNSKGLHVLSSFKHLKSTGWILAANYPVAEAYAPLVEARNLYALVLMAGTVFMVLFVWMMMHRYMAPLHTMALYVSALPEHISNRTQLKIESGNEIEVLAGAFNTMLDEIAEHQKTLEESEINFRAIAENANDGFMVLSNRGRFVYANRQAAQITNYSVDELTSMKVSDLVPFEEMDALRRKYQHTTNYSAYETAITSKDGHTIPVEVSTARTVWKGKTAELIIFRDISDRRIAELALRASEERYRVLVEYQSDLVVKTDPDGNLLFVSPSLCEYIGKQEAELLGTSITDLVHIEDRQAVQEARKEMNNPPYECNYEHRIVVENNINWFAWSENAVLSGDRIEAIIAVGRNVTHKKAAEEEIRKLAYYDVLTSLPNRALLYERLNQAIAQAARDKRHVGLLFLDLDNFKNINDSMGHSIGDNLLCDIARRLENVIRKTDTLARLGGDEFVIALTAVNKAEDVSLIANNVLAALSAPLDLQGIELYTSASIGISIFPEDGNDIDTLLKHADLAMYKAKDHGRNNFKFFSHDMNEKVTERLLLENNLRKACERGELFLVYQPQVNIQTGQLVGVESLVRWQHPLLGLVPPDRFIPLAEETGLINPIGQWILRSACQQAMTWHTAGLPPIRVAVNISARQFAQHDFLESVQTIVSEVGLPTDWLELELTESAIMTDVERTAQTLHELKDSGISISIDDFGTGYSSLSNLKRFPLDRLKIDRSFVTKVHENTNDGAIAEAIIRMSHSLGLNVIAEGIELNEQLTFLAERGCNEMQGYLLSKPLSVDDAGIFMSGCRAFEG